MLHLILADSELERVPKEISGEPLIREEARKRGKDPTEILLNSNYHHGIMEEMVDSYRRGRPDLVHVCMLYALESPLNKDNMLRLYIHTRNDEVIKVKPKTRIPRSFNRFVGLIEQLFKEGGVPPGDPLMELEKSSLKDIVKEIQPERTFIFSSKGVDLTETNCKHDFSSEDPLCAVIGGFPKGDFISNVESLSDSVVSIYPKPLNSVTVVGHVIQIYEEEFTSWPYGPRKS
ncbi:MAG: 16S rRNA methyltransferase [Candidatus Hadarchaeia archaeon]